MSDTKRIKNPLDEHIQCEYEKVVAVCGKKYEKYPHAYQLYEYFRMGFLASDEKPFAYAKRIGKDSFLSGTEFVAKETLDKLCEWLDENLCVVYDEYGYSYVCVASDCDVVDFIEKFKKEMKLLLKL